MYCFFNISVLTFLPPYQVFIHFLVSRYKIAVLWSEAIALSHCYEGQRVMHRTWRDYGLHLVAFHVEYNHTIKEHQGNEKQAYPF